MALPSSGQLTLAQIRDEFGSGTTSNVNLRTLSSAAGLSTPDQFSDFYGLSAYTPPTYASSSGTSGFSISGAGTPSSPYSWSTGEISGGRDYGSFYEYSYYCGNQNFSVYVVQYYRDMNIRFTSNYTGPQKVTIDITSIGVSGIGPLCVSSPGDTYAYAGHQMGGASQNQYTYSTGDIIWTDPTPGNLRNLGPVSGQFNTSAGSDVYYSFYAGNQTEDYTDDNWRITSIAGTIYFEPV